MTCKQSNLLNTFVLKGQLRSGGTKFGPLFKGHLYSGEREHFFLLGWFFLVVFFFSRV